MPGVDSRHLLILVIFIVLLIGIINRDVYIFIAGLLGYLAYTRYNHEEEKQSFTPGIPRQPRGTLPPYYQKSPPFFQEGESGELYNPQYLTNSNGEIITIKQAALPDPFLDDNTNPVFQEQLKRQRMTNNPYSGVGRVSESVYADFVTADPPWYDVALDALTLGQMPNRTG